MKMSKAQLLRSTLLAALAVPGMAAPAFAQEGPAEERDVVVVTGTRITTPGVESSSQIASVGESEIELFQQPEVEKIIRLLPMTVPGDGQNVNNGTAGAATVNLRGLGPKRNLILMNGQRITPFDFEGEVDTQVIPTALLERIDIITGGASAVYGSDAMSGAINFITKRDFQGVDLDSQYSVTGEDDGQIYNVALTVGANAPDGNGNVVASLNYAKREGVQGGARPLGRLGIETASGAGLAQFAAGQPPTPPADANCQAENSVAAGGSTTTTPTRLQIFGASSLGQVRTDNTIGPNCGVFNFNPYNYYQTPQERFGGTAIGYYTINENFEPYVRASFSQTNVTQQVAPSGIFGSPFWTPLANPFLSAQQQGAIIAQAQADLVAGTLLPDGTLDADGNNLGNWRDLDSSGTVTAADDLNIVYRRRTTEFGPRSTSFKTNWLQLVAGMRGQITDNWDYDVLFSHGESSQTRINAGYTNLGNIPNALNAVDPNVCRTGGSSCVPLNLFGHPAGITQAMAQYSSATGIEVRDYRQDILQATVSGSLDQVKMPWADSGVAVSLGAEYREEEGGTTPDECLKLAPTSCLGGAGGFISPISGGFSAYEYFGEAIIPIASGQPFADSLDLELGYRYADYDPTDSTETWKVGLSWAPIPELRFRAMQQQAVRAPNVEEIASPRTTGLDNALLDPCSVANAGNIDAALTALCISTGMTAAQVGTVEDIVAGQINVFIGTNVAALPEPETADTTTFGLVWTPDASALFGGVVTSPTFTLDYYNIKIEDYIDAPPAQDILDGCYTDGIAEQCDRIFRIGGTLTVDGSGVETLFENLEYIQAEGIEVGANFGVDLQTFGSLDVSFNANYFLTQEFNSFSNLPVSECVGFYSASCGGSFGTPTPEIRWIQRTTWNLPYMDNAFQVGYLWRHIGEVESDQDVFDYFQTIPAYGYFDLISTWQINEATRLSAGVTNVLDETPPVVGNEAADTGNNSLNTFPSTYDALGRVFSIGVNLRF